MAVHFTWLPELAAARAYPRLPDFAGLVERLDPRGVFTNDWLRSHVLGR